MGPDSLMLPVVWLTLKILRSLAKLDAHSLLHFFLHLGDIRTNVRAHPRPLTLGRGRRAQRGVRLRVC